MGDDGAAIPFLRYLPERLAPLGARVETALRGRRAEAPSFVAFEGYDAVAVLAHVLRFHGADRVRTTDLSRSARVAARDRGPLRRPKGVVPAPTRSD